MASPSLLVFTNPAFRSYVLWSTVLVLKMLAMSVLTGLQRFKKKAFVNPEDLHTTPGARIRLNDEDVERVRRAHLNDLENILPFFVVGLFYVLTNPNANLASVLFQVAASARLVHTVVYAVYVVPQPARAISWFIHYGITAYFAVQVLLYVL